MTNYYIHAILLADCPYSIKASELLNNYKIKNQIDVIAQKDKEKFKMENYFTYPQIFLKKEGSNNSLFIGGYSDLNSFINTFKNNYNEANIKIFQEKYKLSKKAVLRFIELINT